MADILEKYPSLKKFEGIDDEDIVEVSKSSPVLITHLT